MLLDLQKLSQMAQKLKFNCNLMCNNKRYTHALSKNIKCVAINSQVCFHRWLLAGPNWCITKPVEPLESANQNWRGVTLLPMSVSSHPVDRVHLCHLLRAQHHCLCSNDREVPPSACSPTSPPSSYLPPT